MNDPNLENAAFQACREVIGHQAFNLIGSERMQIQNTIDGQLNGFIHAATGYERIASDATAFKMKASTSKSEKLFCPMAA